MAADIDARRRRTNRRRLDAIRPGSALGVGADIGTEAGNVALIEAADDRFGQIDLFFANAGVGIGAACSTLRRRSGSKSFDGQHPRPPLGREAPDARLARPRRGLLLLDRVGGRAAQPDRLGAVHAHQARCGRLRRVAQHHLRRCRGVRVSCLCPQGVNTNMLNAGDDATAAARPAVSCGPSGVVLEPAEVAEVVLDAITARDAS